MIPPLIKPGTRFFPRIASSQLATAEIQAPTNGFLMPSHQKISWSVPSARSMRFKRTAMLIV